MEGNVRYFVGTLALLAFLVVGLEFTSPGFARNDELNWAKVLPDQTVISVKPGDTMWDITESHGRNGFQFAEIAAENPQVPDPDKIWPEDELALPLSWGKRLAVPAAPIASATLPAPPPVPQTPPVVNPNGVVIPDWLVLLAVVALIALLWLWLEERARARERQAQPAPVPAPNPVVWGGLNQGNVVAESLARKRQELRERGLLEGSTLRLTAVREGRLTTEGLVAVRYGGNIERVERFSDELVYALTWSDGTDEVVIRRCGNVVRLAGATYTLSGVVEVAGVVPRGGIPVVEEKPVAAPAPAVAPAAPAPEGFNPERPVNGPTVFDTLSRVYIDRGRVYLTTKDGRLVSADPLAVPNIQPAPHPREDVEYLVRVPEPVSETRG